MGSQVRAGVRLERDSCRNQSVVCSTSARLRKKMDAVLLYYDETYPSVKEQKAFEKNIFNKTHRTDSEIALLEGLTVVYKSSIDLYFYVIGSSHENELMLMAVLNCLFDSLSQMLRKNVEKRTLLENMDGLFLAVDEIIDGGVILESDPQQVVHRVALRGDDVPLTEQTVSQVLQSAKEQIKWSLLR
ncbi:coatomer subunit zeta-1 isoform X2 [Phyllobates terribilis]|uniref:coatomer subunit zeta-1 isoform X2 n=1 Tax=Phyllobates terribilis TaxID=111132 RepID=UPI003CCA8CBA